jgi:hypothetical protein
MVKRRDTSLDKEAGISPHSSVRLFLPVNLAGADREERRFAPGPAERYEGGRYNEVRRFERKEDAQMEELMSLKGPVLVVNGQLTLLVPLQDGGAESIDRSRGASEAEGSCLQIAIPEWIAGMLRIEAGDIICVSNWDGELEIRPQSGCSVN